MARIQDVVAGRTYNIVPVVEGLYDMGNLAAVCRSADALGYGAVHCVKNSSDRYRQSQRVTAGADKWLDVRLWSGSRDCLGALREAGYQLVVTHLGGSETVTIQDVDWTRPTAFVLGNERAGVSAAAIEMADQCTAIPMAGFVESFNISVAAALIMYEAQQQRVRRLGAHGDLSQQQRRQLEAEFLLRGTRHSSMLVKEAQTRESVSSLLHRPPRAHQSRFFRGSGVGVSSDGSSSSSWGRSRGGSSQGGSSSSGDGGSSAPQAAATPAAPAAQAA